MWRAQAQLETARTKGASGLTPKEEARVAEVRPPCLPPPPHTRRAYRRQDRANAEAATDQGTDCTQEGLAAPRVKRAKGHRAPLFPWILISSAPSSGGIPQPAPNVLVVERLMAAGSAGGERRTPWRGASALRNPGVPSPT